MACSNQSQLPTPVCGGPPVLIYLQLPGDSQPTPAWVTATCDDGVITGFNYFSNQAATVPLVGYTIANRVPTPADVRGFTCETALATNLCPATISQIDSIVDDQTAALNAVNILPQINYSYVLTYNANQDIATLTRNGIVNGVATCQTKSYTYDGFFNLTGISEWVACP